MRGPVAAARENPKHPVRVYSYPLCIGRVGCDCTDTIVSSAHSTTKSVLGGAFFGAAVLGGLMDDGHPFPSPVAARGPPEGIPTAATGFSCSLVSPCTALCRPSNGAAAPTAGHPAAGRDRERHRGYDAAAPRFANPHRAVTMPGLTIAAALLVDAAFGEIRRGHPLAGFGWLASRRFRRDPVLRHQRRMIDEPRQQGESEVRRPDERDEAAEGDFHGVDGASKALCDVHARDDYGEVVHEHHAVVPGEVHGCGVRYRPAKRYSPGTGPGPIPRRLRWVAPVSSCRRRS